MNNEQALKYKEQRDDDFEVFCDDFDKEIKERSEEINRSYDDATAIMYNEYRWGDG